MNEDQKALLIQKLVDFHRNKKKAQKILSLLLIEMEDATTDKIQQDHLQKMIHLVIWEIISLDIYKGKVEPVVRNADKVNRVLKRKAKGNS